MHDMINEEAHLSMEWTVRKIGKHWCLIRMTHWANGVGTTSAISSKHKYRWEANLCKFIKELFHIY